MKVVLSLCCVMLAVLSHPIGVKDDRSSFRTIKIHQTESGYSYFDSMTITSSEDLKAFLDEVTQQLRWGNRQAFINALLQANVDFNEEALVLLRHDEGIGASHVSFETPVLQEKTLLCKIRSEFRGAGIGAMPFHCFALAVSKSLVDRVQFTMVTGPEERPRTTIILSTTQRQPFNMRRDPPPPPQPAPSECPKLIISCPTDLLETGKTYLVKVRVEGGDVKDNGNFNWSVTGAEIVGGQGTRALAVRINEPNKKVEAWVSLGGIDPHCDPVANCSCGPSK
jgi:hypothetical protein